MESIITCEMFSRERQELINPPAFTTTKKVTDYSS